MAQPGRGAAAGGETSILTVALCFCVAVFEGIDLQAAGVAAPKLGPAFHMSPGQLGWFFSASTFGLMLGAAVGGRLSDRFGRKAVLIGALAFFGLLTVATALSPSVTWLLTNRFLTGVGLGGALPNVLALTAENTAPNRRNTAVGALYGGMPTGGALASLVSVFGASGDWRLVFYLGGFAPLLLAPVLYFLLPDSRELNRAKQAAGAEGLHPRSVGFALLGESRAARTILLWVAFFLSLLTMYVLLNWLPSLMVSRGLSRPSASWVQMAFNVCGALASAVTGMTMDRLPLNKVVFGSFLLAAVGLVVLWLAPVALAISVVVGGVVGATISATQALLYSLAPATYPTQVRGTGVGAAVAVGRLGSAVGPLLAAALLGSGGSPQQVLMVLIPIILCGGAAALILSFLIGGRARASAAAAAAAH